MPSLRAMRGVRDLRSGLLSLFSVLALTGMVLRALIPSGYMVSSGTDSSSPFEVTICYGGAAPSDPFTIHIGDSDGEKPRKKPGQSGGDHSPCAFAMTAHFTTPLALVDATLPRLKELALAVASTLIIPGRGLAAPPPPVRGPPLSV